MKSLIILLFPVLLFGQSTWVLFEAESPKFSILFPSKPQEKEKFIRTDIAEFEVKTIYLPSSLDSTENTLYLLNYYELDQIIFFGDSAISRVDYLNQAVKNIAFSLDAKVLYSNNSIFNGCNTNIYRLDMNNNDTVMKGKFVLSGNYFYSLQVFSTKQYSLNKNMNKFIDSFEFEKCD